MTILALDTATDSVSCALIQDKVVLGEIYLHVGLKHSVTLMPSVQCLLEMAKMTKDRLEAVAVFRGPGSFTGIRIGLSTASALAYGLKLPVYAVSTLDALIAGAGRNGVVCAALDARRGEVYVKAMQDERVLISESAMPLSQVCERLQGEAPLFMGDAGVRYRAQIENQVPRARFLPEGLSMPHAQYAASAVERGLFELCEHDTLRASYLRASQAERQKEGR